MPLGDFAEQGTLKKPLIIGRLARLILAGGAGYFFVLMLTDYADLVGSSVPTSTYWIGVAVAFWYFSDLVVVGLSREWGRWPQVAVFPLALALVIADLVAYEGAWAPPLAWGVYVFTEFFFGFIAISFLLSAIVRSPG